MMKGSAYLFFIFLTLLLTNCSKDQLSNDEYEIINLLISEIRYPPPPPPPFLSELDKLSDAEYNQKIDSLIRKDSIEQLKIKLVIHFEDSLKGLSKNFKNMLYEENIGFEEFYLMDINEEYTHSKKIDMRELQFPKNVVLWKPNKNEKVNQIEKVTQYWISRILFNKEKNKAVVEFNSLSGPLSGGGSKVYLMKTDDKWQIIHFFDSWVS